jgi:hypothetical protein
MRKKSSSKKSNGKSRRMITVGKTRKQHQRQDSASDQRTAQSRTSTQSGDLQGLRDVESADSESVNELLEEGNAFEADVVAGVEQADENQEREVHTREVPEDDVPGEYLEKD